VFDDQYTVTQNRIENDVFLVLSSVTPQSVLWPLPFNICTHDLCDVINHCLLFFFASNLKICVAISSPSSIFNFGSQIFIVYINRVLHTNVMNFQYSVNR
jgi:hypothetical protein